MKLLFDNAANLRMQTSIKKTPVQVFSSEFYDIFRNNYSIVNMKDCFTLFQAIEEKIIFNNPHSIIRVNIKIHAN